MNASNTRPTGNWEYAYAYGAVNPYTLTGPTLYAYQNHYPIQENLADVTLNGGFDIFGHRQELTFGGNWQDVDAGGSAITTLPVSNSAVNVFDFNPASYPQPAGVAYPGNVYADYGQKQQGLYATLRSQIAGPLHSVAGVRYGEYQSDYLSLSYNTTTGALKSSLNRNYSAHGIVTPYGGLTYDLTRSIALYGSYARIFEPQGTYVDVSGGTLKPVTGNSYEVGAKGSWLNGALNASLAAYDVKRENAAIQQPGVSGSFGNLYCCYVAAAQMTSKGIEAEVNGQLLPGWQLSASYAYNINKYVEGYGASDGAVYTPQTPKHLVKLWTMAQLPGSVSKVRVGGGINAQSSTFVPGSATTYDSTGVATGSVPYQFTQGSYVVASLRGEYQLTSHWSAALNVNNLFDRTYYQTVGSSGGGNFYGDPRNYVVSVHGAF